MSCSPTKKLITVCCAGKAASGETSAECHLKTESGAIAKVLSVHADACLNGREILGDCITYEGTLKFRVLYIDGEGMRRVLSESCRFQDKLSVKTGSSQSVLLKVGVGDVSTTKVETDGITLKGVVDVHAYVFGTESVDCVTDCGEGVYGKTCDIRCMTIVGTADSAVTVSAEKELDVEGEILTLDADVCMTGTTPRVDGFVAEGLVAFNAVFKAADGQLKNQCFTAPFCEEVPLAGITAEASVDTVVCVRAISYSLTKAEGVPTALKCEVILAIAAVGCMPSTETVVVDAYEPSVQMKLSRSELKTCSVSCVRVVKNVQGTATLSEGMPALDTVLGVTAARIGVAGVYPSAGKATVEGLLSCSVLYYNKEFGTTNSVAVELPYSVVLDVNSQANSGTAVITDINAKSLRTGSLDVAAEVRFDLRAENSVAVSVLTEMSEGETTPASDAGITVGLAAEGMALWDLARALDVPPEAVMNSNSDIVFPTKGGEKILLYRPLSL